MFGVQITAHLIRCMKCCRNTHLTALGLFHFDATILEHVLGKTMNIYLVSLFLLHIAIRDSGFCIFLTT
jgi:hypothetical protein